MKNKNLYTKKLGLRVALSARPANSGKLHVIVSEGQKWSIVADGNIRASKTFANKSEAVRYAKQWADRIKGEVIIHNKDGGIEERVLLAS